MMADNKITVSSLPFNIKTRTIKIVRARTPQLSVIYGAAGTCKTTVAAYAKTPYFLQLGYETGVQAAIGAFMAKIGSDNAYNDLLGALSAFANTSERGKIETLVIDNATELAGIVDNMTKAMHGGNLDPMNFTRQRWPLWSVVLDAICKVVESGLDVILIGHPRKITTWGTNGGIDSFTLEAPTGETKNTDILTTILQRANNVFYIEQKHRTKTVKGALDKGDGKNVSVGHSGLYINTVQTGGYYAKNRLWMQDDYKIEQSDNEYDLYVNKSNESINDFWNDFYNEKTNED